MSNGLEIKIEGFDHLERLIKKLPDEVKKKEINKFLIQAADPLYQMMKQMVPVSTGMIKSKSGSYRIKKRRVGKAVLAESYDPGYGKRTIAKKKLTRSKNALISIGPHTRKGKDGYYLRQWVIPGTIHFKGKNFIESASKATENTILPLAQKKIARYVQKQIDKLSK